MNFWKLFRLIFVLFFLYILGDAFFRWDGFAFYGSFMEFWPGLALISVLWVFLAILTTVIIWLSFRIIEKSCYHLKLKISPEHLILFLCFFILLGVTILGIKIYAWSPAQSTLQLKTGILAGIIVISFVLTWLFRNKAELWITTVHERITPLVWMFGGFVLLCIPVVGYFAWSNQTGKTVSNNYIGSAVTDTDRPNIILITFDALTARDMSVYGYAKETTPFISEWAKSATVFTRSEAASNYTSSTTASLMTGKRVWTHRRFQSEGSEPDKSKTESLPLLLKKYGYYNMAFMANHIASAQELGMFNSFMTALPSYEFSSPSSFYGVLFKHLLKLFGSKIKNFDWILKEDFILYRMLPGKYFKYPSRNEFPIKKVMDSFWHEVDKNNYRPFFAWIHTYPPHLPYLPPGEYANMFDASPKYRTAKAQEDLVGPRYFTQEQQVDADILRSRYDAFIRYCDKEFRDFIKQLGIRGLLKNTIIILSSDHGESFEHGYFTHGGPLLFEQMTHIPLIIREPGQIGGKIIDDLVDQADLPATILDFAGIPIPLWMEGRSLVPLLRGDKLPSRPVFSMDLIEVPVAAQINTGTVAVWEGDYKLIHYIQKDKSLLFNLKEDLSELNDLYEKEPEVSRRLLDLILNNLGKANEKIKGE